MNMFDKVKTKAGYFFAKRFIKAIKKNLENGSLSFKFLEKKTGVRGKFISKLARRLLDERDAGTMMMKQFFKSEHGTEFLQTVLNKRNPNCRNKLIKNFAVRHMLLGTHLRRKVEKEIGTAPFVIVISPIAKCNLNCVGCYAGEYPKTELDFKTVDRIIREGKDIGIYFYTISGGEPFCWPYLFKMLKKHNDCIFLIYTNGTLINDNIAKRLAKTGNAIPAISIEGFAKETDNRRKRGVFNKVMKAMDSLKKHGVLFGFSATLTRKNFKAITSRNFIEFYSKKGCLFGWYFQYLPIGSCPDTGLMPTPEQRNALREITKKIREELPIFVGDFWNDGTYVYGCMAGGRKYLHINANGDIEPCVFAHFAVDNIKNTNLKSALNSKFFRMIRSLYPVYSKNMLAPCMIIDNPWVLRQTVEKCGAYPTHKGAEAVIKNKKIADFLERYSAKIHRITSDSWEKEYRELL